MATFFGEILQSESRAFYDDDDDEDTDEESSVIECQTSYESVIRWSPRIRKEIEDCQLNTIFCTNLVIAIGEISTSFISKYILEKDSEKIGIISCGLKNEDVNTISQSASTDKTCFIYQLKSRKDVIIVQCNTDVSPEQSYSWTHNLMDKINHNKLYAVIISPNQIREYKTQLPSGDITEPFLRALKTSKFKGTPICPYLEQPNMITGLPAQLISYCEIFKIPAVSYTCFSNYARPDAYTMKLLKGILNVTPLKDLALKVANKEDEKRNLVKSTPVRYETLYM